MGGNGTLNRRHDLDALRAVAMLLGIVLHAALSFAPIPWTINDNQQSEFYEVIFAVIHGFRMPLFFLISGFFTAMLWRRYGLRGLIKQRLKRIVLPLVAGLLTIVPLMWAISSLAFEPSNDSDEVKYFDAAAAGDTETLKLALQFRAIEIDALHPNTGASLLTVATFCGHPETVEMLLKKGADPNQKNKDLATPLHVAAFMGRVESTRLLLNAGANLETRDGNGKTPNENLKIDFATTNLIATLYGQSLDETELKEGRSQIAKLLGEDQSVVSNAHSAGLGGAAFYGLLFQLPFYMHLWFLAFLCWLVAGFVGYAFLVRTLKFSSIPRWLFCSPVSLIWLVPLTMIPQNFMLSGIFGPDPSIGILPIPSVLGYYAIFFYFGAFYWELDDNEGHLGRYWYISLPVALFIVFPIGLEMSMGTFGIESLQSFGPFKQLLSTLLQALFAWLMVFGCIGMFRAFLSNENKTMRYISDSSYWIYLTHLPLVMVAQWLVSGLEIPAMIKFVSIIVVVSGLLLLTYEYLVRYSVVGSVLNGPRKRERSAQTT